MKRQMSRGANKGIDGWTDKTMNNYTNDGKKARSKWTVNIQ